MIIRPLLAAGLCAFLTMPAAAQESADAPPRADPPGEPRIFVQALADYRRKGKPHPIGLSNAWITNTDYPLASWRNGEEGKVQYDLAVDAAGKVTGCTITYSNASPALETETCRLLLERASFEPAVGADGKPMASVHAGETDWERRGPEYSSSFMLKIAFTLDERGQQRDCRIIERSGTIPAAQLRSLERRPCPSGFASRGVPYRDAEGQPVAREVTLVYGVEVGPVPSQSGDAVEASD